MPSTSARHRLSRRDPTSRSKRLPSNPLPRRSCSQYQCWAWAKGCSLPRLRSEVGTFVGLASSVEVIQRWIRFLANRRSCSPCLCQHQCFLVEHFHFRCFPCLHLLQVRRINPKSDRQFKVFPFDRQPVLIRDACWLFGSYIYINSTIYIELPAGIFPHTVFLPIVWNKETIYSIVKGE